MPDASHFGVFEFLRHGYQNAVRGRMEPPALLDRQVDQIMEQLRESLRIPIRDVRPFRL